MKRCSKFLILFAFFLLDCPGFYAHAADVDWNTENNTATNPRDQALHEVTEELRHKERRWYGLMRIRWHDTQKLSAGLGAILVNQPSYVDCSIGCSLKGWNLEIEPGLHGIQAGIGWGSLIGETGRTNRLLHTVHFGWNVRGVVLRTWGDSSLYPKSQTLAGIEASLSIIRLNISLGVLKSLYSGPDEQFADDWVVTTGFGWGF